MEERMISAIIEISKRKFSNVQKNLTFSRATDGIEMNKKIKLMIFLDELFNYRRETDTYYFSQLTLLIEDLSHNKKFIFLHELNRLQNF